MKKDEYLQTIEVNGVKVDIGLDDYGQCYFYEYKDPKTGELVQNSCGTYNTEFADQIYYELDPKYKELLGKFIRNGLTPEEKELYDSYEAIFREIER